MITGFNTDVKCGDKVFHVQTEDKGSGNPLIESLIYVKGAILDAYRTSYEDFLSSQTFSESTLQKILEFQHRQIVTCIKKGKFKKGMALKAFSEGQFVFDLTGSKGTIPIKIGATAEAPDAHAIPSVECDKPCAAGTPPVSREVTKPRDLFPNYEAGSDLPVNPPYPRPNRIELAIDVSEATDLLADRGIEICVEGSKEFVGGSHVDLGLFVQSRGGRLRLENVQVIVKIIGTTFSPRLYAGKTDKSGALRMNFNLPAYSAGSAALIIQASTPLGNDEIKYLIKRK
jgi:hypothetical protein